MRRLRIQNVPLPAKRGPFMPEGEWRARGKQQSYADLRRVFGKLKIGQSIVYTGRHAHIHQTAYKCGIAVKIRTLDGNPIPLRGLVKVRIWRIK